MSLQLDQAVFRWPVAIEVGVVCAFVCICVCCLVFLWTVSSSQEYYANVDADRFDWYSTWDTPINWLSLGVSTLGSVQSLAWRIALHFFWSLKPTLEVSHSL